MEKYESQIINADFSYETKHSYTKKQKNKRTRYCNDIFCFDIETTSAWIENGKIIPYRKGESSEYWNSLTPLSLCYIWQFSFNDKVYYGRELRDFEQVLKDLPPKLNCVIWVHNLPYEFHFLNNFLTWKTVFARTPHNPMKAVPKEYPNIEFRCSYHLTRLSLESWGKQIGYHKAVGDLDYEKLRTPLTPLTDKELGYCEDDVLVMYHGLQGYREKYGSIRNIPLTQTGTVRREVKNMLMSDASYCKGIKKLIPKNAHEYKRLMEVFAGGYTHANRYYSGEVQKGNIKHFDFASSYPSVMVSERFPMKPWEYVFNNNLPTKEQMDKYAYILHLRFKNIKSKTFNTYIQFSKCECNNPSLDNGRVLKADDLEMYMTEQDWLTISETYKYESVEVLDKWASLKDYLPKKFIEYILELYCNKTTLKGIEDMEDLYMQSKQYINSMYGMSVTSIVQPDIEFDGSNWNMGLLTEEKVDNELNSLRRWVSDKRYFLSYSWGCWITSYARRNLWKCLIPNDFNILYCDTDSIFVLGECDFSWYNREIDDKMKKVCNTLGIDFEKTRPVAPDGKKKPLGYFESEKDCIEFKTLGAKRYVERRNDGKLYLTVSGINKEAVKLLNNNIDNFSDGFNFDKDADCVKKQLLTYLLNMPSVTYPDGYYSTYKEGINMRRNGYLLTMTDEYKDLIKFSKMTYDDLDEKSILRIMSDF